MNQFKLKEFNFNDHVVYFYQPEGRGEWGEVMYTYADDTIKFEIVRNLAVEYAESVKRVLPVERVVLYGSHVKGTASPLSDVDICFFLSDFDGKRRVDIIGELLGLCGRYRGAYFEPNAFPVSEIERGNPFVQEILATGIEI